MLSAEPGLSLTSSLNPAPSGAGVTLTATLSGGNCAATGTVEFFDGAASLGSVALTGGRAMLETASLIPGTHAITATYSGDANHLPATAPAFSQIIDPVPDTIPPGVVLSAITGPVGGVYTAVASFSEPVSAQDPSDLPLTHASAIVSGGAEAFTITLTLPAEGAQSRPARLTGSMPCD